MKYRKKPVVIDAVQLRPEQGVLPEGVEQYEKEAHETLQGNRSSWYGWRVKTLEGYLEAKPYDWIITGVQGERYPCKPDIFEATYEPIEDSHETTQA